MSVPRLLDRSQVVAQLGGGGRVRSWLFLDDGQSPPVGGVGVLVTAGVSMDRPEGHESSDHGVVGGAQGGAGAGEHAAQTSVGGSEVAGGALELAEPGLDLAPPPYPFVLLAPEGVIEQRRRSLEGLASRHEITARLSLVTEGDKN
jgi:hypothetical protein